MIAPNSPTTTTNISSSSTSHIKHYKPYFTPIEVERLSAKQRGKLSVSREERGRQQACGFIDAVGSRCGFPRRTIATAQTLYMRFHLFFPYKDFNYVEVSLSALYVSSKLHDTLKKPRDIILSSYPIRFPQLVKKGTIDLAALDPRMLEEERGKVLGVERLILETICFKFGVEVGLVAVVKIGRALGLDKDMCQQAWRVAVDCYRTQAPLSFPSHVIALASIYTSCILSLETDFLKPKSGADSELESQSATTGLRKRALELVGMLGGSGSWEDDYSATADQVDDVTHYLLDLYITILSIPNPNELAHHPSPVSPKESPATNSTVPTQSPSTTAYSLSPFWTSQTLTEVKIRLRETRPGRAVPVGTGWIGTMADTEGNPGQSREVEEAIEGMGQNDKTVRFLWDVAGQ